MSRNFISVAFAVLGLVALQTGPAHACACCTDPGQRSERSDAASSYERDELNQIRFAPTATLYASPGFPDDVAGVVEPSSGPYRLRGAIRGNQISFEVIDDKGRRGSILMAFPPRLTRFEVDPREGEDMAAGNGPALYKEWRLSGLVKLGGILRGAAQATLILHGRGNSCTSASDFDKWTLNVRGNGVAFTFLGTLLR